jgi:hypothetical protein
MLQGLAHTICVYAKKASGGGADNTPNAVTWNDTFILFSKKAYGYAYSSSQISGISSSITLKVEFSDTAFPYFYYKVDNSVSPPALPSPPTSNSFINILHNGTFSVANNEYVRFCPIRSTTGTVSTTVTIKNVSDGNATLDTFTASTIN